MSGRRGEGKVADGVKGKPRQETGGRGRVALRVRRREEAAEGRECEPGRGGFPVAAAPVSMRVAPSDVALLERGSDHGSVLGH